jgi:peptide/nickel transport system substrate-binding protein
MIRHEGKLHRRGRLALGVSLPLALALAIAVSAQASPKPRAAAGSTAVSSITWGIDGQDPANLSFYTQLDSDGFLLSVVYETLTQPGPGGSVAPLLATSWKQTGPKTWVFQLRHNVRYSNGRLFTSKDVVWSFQHYIKGGTYSFLLVPATKATAVGKYAVRFTLSTALKAFPAQMEAVFIGPSGVNLKNTTLGTGPYMVKSHNKGVSWSLVANPHYWRKGLPRIKTLNVRFIQDAAALGSALRAGTVDFEGLATIDQAHALASSTVKVATVKTPDFYWVAMNAVNPPEPQFKDQRVRQAVNLAIDRSELVKIALGGLGQPSGIPAASWPDGCNVAKVPGGKRNLAQAQALMKAAGVGPFSTTLVISPATGAIAAPELAQVIQSNLKDIGITVNIVTNDIATWVDHTFTKGDVSMSLNWFNGEGDPTQRLNAWNPNVLTALKDFVPDDPPLDTQIAKANSLGRSKARTALDQQICKRVMTDAYMLPLTTKPDFVAYRSDRIIPVFPSLETEGDSVRYIDEFKPAH